MRHPAGGGDLQHFGAALAQGGHERPGEVGALGNGDAAAKERALLEPVQPLAQA